ncbi:unnamed protein product [Prorocentrum cordatum]|uniref:Nudix hydrolase domain-containing protein n=1 Tax=Prorocentrum cordatum TaxID=2364126 RepID=A0ABN9RH38_9DINO|nr:unnamed protein product [Polarella glacialis]
MRRIAECNDGAHLAAQARPLVIGGQELGLVLPRAADELARFPEVFAVGDGAVRLAPRLEGAAVEARSEAVAGVLEQLRSSGRVPMLEGWRDEGWPVKAAFDTPVELVVERAAGPLLGVRGYGCHVNGLVADRGGGAGGWRLWVARRAATKQTYPGKLDHVVAGGLSHGERPGDNVVKECGEEASIPPELAKQAAPVGIVEYAQVDETGWGVKRDVIFCYDLILPESFVPAASDGEVESFELWSIAKVIESIADVNDHWKPNVALVIIDMLVRRGLIAPDEPGYVGLVRALRDGLQ